MTYEDLASTLQTGCAALLCSSMDIRNNILRKLSSLIPIGFDDLDDWEWCNYIYCSGGKLHVCTNTHVINNGMHTFDSALLDDIEDPLSALDRPDIDELIALYEK